MEHEKCSSSLVRLILTEKDGRLTIFLMKTEELGWAPTKVPSHPAGTPDKPRKVRSD